MRIVIWSLIAVAILAAPFGMKLAEHWRDTTTEIASALEAGALTVAEGGPLTLAEKAVVVAEFGDTWGYAGRPCRALDVATLSRFLAGSDEGLPEAAVSFTVARAVLLRDAEGMNALEWHYRNALLSCRLDRRYTDKQLLRMWLPHADFGNNVYGIDNAARTYFGKPADELGLEEAARLAALLRNPSYYVEREDVWSERARRIAARVEERGDL
jgi:hypothetical protein